MNAFLARIEKKILDSSVDQTSSIIRGDREKLLTISSKITFFRVFLALIFVLPAMHFWYYSLTTSGQIKWYLISGAIIFTPILFFMGIFFGFSKDEIRFDLTRHKVSRSFQLLEWRCFREMHLPETGELKLFYDDRHDDVGSGQLLYSISVSGCENMTFTVRGYNKTLSFSKQLSSFLSYGIKNEIPHLYQSDDRSLRRSIRHLKF